MSTRTLTLFIHRWDDGDVLVTFDEPQKAVASGQIVAIWDGDWCLGSGTIKDSW
jgi:tRNA U34 2-thiouridine synthase MnmA/TrmU